MWIHAAIIGIMFYVYSHSNKKHGVFYVGKGTGNRLYATGNRSLFWKRITRKHGYKAEIIAEFESEDDAFSKEIETIRFYRGIGQCAANFSDGGDGVRVAKRWWGDKISKSLTGKKGPRGIDSKSYKSFCQDDHLSDLYIKKGLSTVAIGKKFGVSHTTVWSRLKECGIEPRSIHKRGKAVLCTTDGKRYDSITSAARELNLYRENIRKVIYGKYKTTGNKHFKFTN